MPEDSEPTTRRMPAAESASTAEYAQVDAAEAEPGWSGRAAVGADRPVLGDREQTEQEESRRSALALDERERPRRSPAGCLFWLAGLLAVLVVVALGAKVTGLWPDLHNPFAKKQTDRSQPALLLSIQDLSRFEAASGNFQVIVDVQNDRSYIPDIIFNDRVLFVAAGSVDAYVDFSHIGSGDIKDSADHKTAEIHLPAPQLEKANLDEDKTYVYAQDRGLYQRVTSLFSNDAGKMQEMNKLGVQKIEDAAKASDLANRAAENTRKMLEQLLKSLGYTSITVTFANP